jgi:uncharacterized SAM-binding protein YcdF (DUF218 family)
MKGIFPLTVLLWVIPVLILLAPISFFIWMHAAPLRAVSADALIVLGYRCDHDQIHPLLKERLDTVLALMEQYEYRRIIVSGGAVASKLTEAEIMKRYLMDHGVPEEKIILEDRSRNTVHNAVNSFLLMQEHGLTSCLLVSNSFHIRRMQFIMKQLQIPAAYYANRRLSNIMKQWSITFQEIRAYKLTLPWIDKVKAEKTLHMMGK